jgi:hypothetical protein
MFTYKVTWEIVRLVWMLILPEPKYDKFGRDTANYQAIYPVEKYDTIKLTRPYVERKAAIAFYNEVKADSAADAKARKAGIFPEDDHGRFINIRYDSIKIK